MRYNALISIMSKAPAFDPDAELFFNAESAAGVTLTTTEKNAVNQWVIDAKAAGIWTKFKAIYPVVGGTATSHKFNLKNPADTNAAFRLSFIGGWTHSATGMTPNGTNAWADTFCLPSNMGVNSSHLSYYSRVNTDGRYDMGMFQQVYNPITATNTTTACWIAIRSFTTNASATQINQTQASYATTNTNSIGHFIGNRTASTVSKLIRNGVALHTTSTVSTFSPTLANISIGAALYRQNSGTIAPDGYSNRQCAFATIGDGLTDLEAQIFYQITEKYQLALSRNVNTTQSFYYNPAYNNETNAFLFSTQITDATIQTATNTLVTDLKTANIWTKMKAIYPMVGGTATTHKFNLVNAQDTNAAFRLSFIGGWTHSANGALPNGTNGYANTFCAGTNLTSSNLHISYYSRTDSGSGGWDVGVLNTATSGFIGFVLASTNANCYLNSINANRISVATANSLGYYVGSRTANNSWKLFKNNTTIGTRTTGIASATYNIYIGARNTNNTSIADYANRECAFATIGDGLTDLEATALYNAVNTFQTTLGRNV